MSKVHKPSTNAVAKTATHTVESDVQRNVGRAKKNSRCAAKLKSVRNAIDQYGRRTGHLVLTVRAPNGACSHALIPEINVLKGTIDSIGAPLLELSLLAIKSAKAIREMAERIMSIARGNVYVASRSGFHRFCVSGNQYDCYVRGSEVFWCDGNETKAMIVLNNQPHLAASCDIHVWQEKIGKFFSKNPYLLFVACAALASYCSTQFALKRLTLALIALSTTGKTSLQQAVQSVNAPGFPIRSTSGSAKGLRALISNYPDQPLMLDELRQTEDIGGVLALLFDVSNSGSRNTSTSSQMLNSSSAPSAGIVFSNERTFQELAAGKRVLMDEGFAARYFEVFLIAEHGAFHHVPPNLTAARFADLLKRRSNEYYGAFAPLWIEHIAKNASKISRRKLKRVPKLTTLLRDGVDVNDVTARLLAALSEWCFVGEIAIEAGLLTATRDQLHAAFKLVVREYLSRQANGLTPTGERVISKVRELLDTHGNKFTPFNRGISDGLSYGRRYQSKKHGELFLILPHVFEQFVSSDFGLGAATNALRAAGFLVANPGGDQFQVRMSKTDKTRKRFYAISSDIRLDGD